MSRLDSFGGTDPEESPAHEPAHDGGENMRAGSVVLERAFTVKATKLLTF